MPKKDTKKKTTKPRVLKQKQKQSQKITININNKAPRKSAPKKQSTPSTPFYPQVINTYPVFMQTEPSPPIFYNTPTVKQEIPKIEQVQEKVKVKPTIFVPDVLPAVLPATVKPKRAYTKKKPVIPDIDVIPPMTIETTTAESSPYSPLKIPKTPPFSPPKIPFLTIDTTTPQNSPDRMIPYPKVKTPIIVRKRNKLHLFPDDYERKQTPLPEGVQDMIDMGAVRYNSKKENSTTRANVAIRVSGLNNG